MELGQYEAARQSFRRAIELDPSSARAQSNPAAALLALNEFPPAETAARRALALAPSLATADYLLGQSLVRQGKLTVGTLEHLRRAAREHPGARIWAANVLLALGDRAGCELGHSIDVKAGLKPAILRTQELPDGTVLFTPWIPRSRVGAAGSGLRRAAPGGFR